jgi:hypothetical protein
MPVSQWAGVGVAVQSALGTARTITAISKASPGVVTSTAHGFANGDYVLLTISGGMNQVDGRVFRVAASAANTFNLEGEDTTNYDNFTSGTAQMITFGTTISTLTTVNASGGDFDFTDTTTIHSLVKTQIPGQASPSVFSFDSIWDVADAGLIALKAASDNKAQRAVRFTFANGQKFAFNGYVGTSLSPTGQAGDKVTTPVTLTAYGRPTVYAT